MGDKIGEFEMKTKYVYQIFTIISFISIVGCEQEPKQYDGRSSTGENPAPREPYVAPATSSEFSLVQFDSCSDLEIEMKNYLLDALKKHEEEILRTRYWEEDVSPASARSDSQIAEGSSEYTTTNNQVVGMQEADIVKNNGKYLFRLDNDQVHIVQVWPADQAKTVSRIDLSDNQPLSLGLDMIELDYFFSSSMLLDDEGNRLIVISHQSLGSRSGRKTIITVYDIENILMPKKIQTHVFSGVMHDRSLRLAGTTLRFVTRESLWSKVLPEFGYKYDMSQEEWEKNIRLDFEHQAKVIEESSVFELIDMPLVENDCKKVFIPKNNFAMEMVRMVTVDLNQNTSNTVFVTSGTNHFYSSDKSFYIADYDYRVSHSYIHKFNIQDPQHSFYAGSGVVAGWLLNQFSMDEHEGVLRLAVTSRSDTSTVNRIVTLAQEGDNLSEIGRTNDLAPGERIYSARFHGEKAYVVTFRQVDPLYTVDLRDPTQPNVVGELKIPGYSSYMQMLDNETILAIGREGTDEGRILGIKVSIFDVSDMRQPIEKFKKVFDLGWSEALWNHHAFTYYASRSKLAFPMMSYSNSDYSSEIVLLDIDKDIGIGEHQSIKVDHDRYYGFDRSFFIEDHIYAVSSEKVVSAHLHDLQGSQHTVSFSE